MVLVRLGSSSLSLPSHKWKVTGSIPGVGTPNFLLMVSISFPKIVIEMLLSSKGEKVTLSYIEIKIHTNVYVGT